MKPQNSVLNFAEDFTGKSDKESEKFLEKKLFQKELLLKMAVYGA